jgi:hypothetical protein
MPRRNSDRRQPVVLDVDEWEHLPAEVYIPVHDVVAGSGDALVELRKMVDARIALLVYSTLDLLFTCWGEQQSAMLVPAERLSTLQRKLGFHAVLLDVSPPAGSTRLAVAQGTLPLALDDATGDPIVYVPSRPFRRTSRSAHVELQLIADGKRALMTYSSLSALLHCCGPNQHFVAFPAGLLAAVLAESGADTVLIDLPLPPRVRH